MRNLKYKIIISLTLLFTAYSLNGGSSLRTSVACKKNPEEKYTVFLPSNYKDGVKLPLLIIFTPDSRTKQPVNLFKKEAEKLSFIIIASENIKNGPRRLIINSMKHLWREIKDNYSFDSHKIICTGFSGGSRSASMFPLIIKRQIHAVIACGAGLQTPMKPENLASDFYFSICGYEDFNFQEIRLLELQLKKIRPESMFWYFKGGHVWPEENLFSIAVNFIFSRFSKEEQHRKQSFKKWTTLSEKIAYDNPLTSYNLFKSSALCFPFTNYEKKTLTDKFIKRYSKFILREKSFLKTEYIKTGRLLFYMKEFDKTKSANNCMALSKKLKLNNLTQDIKSGDYYKKASALRIVNKYKYLFYQRFIKNLNNKNYKLSLCFLKLLRKITTSKKKISAIDYNISALFSLLGKLKKSRNLLLKSIRNSDFDKDEFRKDKRFDRLRNSDKYYKKIKKLLNNKN